MKTENHPQPIEPRAHTSSSQRKRVSTTDLMHGRRVVVLLHEGAEYILRITKAGKLILTK